MARATRPQPAPQPPLPPRGKCAAFTLLAIIILLGLCFLVIWLVIHPKHVGFTVRDAYVYNYNLAHDHLNATFDLTLEINNHNRHVSFYYSFTELSVRYEYQTLTLNTIQPFYQGHRNVTHLHVKAMAQDVPLHQAVSRNLRLERAAGVVELDVQIRMRDRYKVGAWKSKERTVRIYCSPVLGHFTRSRSFEGTKCDVEL